MHDLTTIDLDRTDEEFCGQFSGRQYQICRGENIGKFRREAYLRQWLGIPQPPAVIRPACVHLGSELRREECPTCEGQIDRLAQSGKRSDWRLRHFTD